MNHQSCHTACYHAHVPTTVDPPPHGTPWPSRTLRSARPRVTRDAPLFTMNKTPKLTHCMMPCARPPPHGTPWPG